MKLFIFTKKSFLSLLLLGALLLAAGAAWSTQLSVQANSRAQKRLPIYAVKTSEKRLALTFDCAWENSDTDELLAILQKYEAKATFFTTGDWCERYQEDVKKIYAEGHDIGNHSYAHPHVASIDTDTLIADTKKCDVIVEELIGKTPMLYRAPYGEYSDKMLETLEDKMNKKVIQWDVDSRDWQKKRTASEMADAVCKAVDNGSILLFHNDTPNTPQAVEQLLQRLQKQGYSFVLVRDLILWENYTIDHTGRQQSN